MSTLPSFDERIESGEIYLLGCGGVRPDSNSSWPRTIAEILNSKESRNELRNSRLTILPIHQELRPFNLKDVYTMNRKPPTIPYRPPVPNLPDDPRSPNAQTSLNPRTWSPAQTSIATDSVQGDEYTYGIHGNQNAQNYPGPKADPTAFQELPACYARVLNEICPYCRLLGNILWRNVQQVESRYESRFRPWKSKQGKELCFLQFHTIQAPVLADLEVTLALVHHIHISKQSKDSEPSLDNRQEQIFAFILVKEEADTRDETNEIEKAHRNETGDGWWRSICRKEKNENLAVEEERAKVEVKTSVIIEEHLYNIIHLYQEEYQADESIKHSIADAGITPMLFISAILKWYGFKAAEAVVKGFGSLTKIDDMLLAKDKSLRIGSLEEKARNCDYMDKQLTRLNKSLTGVLSRVNFVSESARNMIKGSCTMNRFAKAEINHPDFDAEFGNRRSLHIAVDRLDSSRFVMRDNEKLDLIGRAMQQYSVDIKSLKAHLAINTGLVSNHYDQLLAEEAVRDNSTVLIIAILGLVLLPMTFAATFISTPMFQFNENTDMSITKKQWQYFGIIFGVTFGFFLIVFFIKYGRKYPLKRNGEKNKRRKYGV